MSEMAFVTEWPVEGGPDGIAVGPDGSVFVNINQNYRVARYSAQGELQAIWPRPAWFAVDPGGNVFVNINQNYRVAMYSPKGKLEAEWGSEGSQPGQFRSLAGVAVSPDGNIYVADKGNNRVQVFRKA
jgi:sugar lactone lactonase YvrE